MLKIVDEPGGNPNRTSLWTLHIDDSSNFKGHGLQLVLNSSNNDKQEQSIQCGFQEINNEAEYKALITGLRREK